MDDKTDPKKYTDTDDLAVLKKSWLKASSTEYKRSPRLYVMQWIVRQASYTKGSPDKVHRHR